MAAELHVLARTRGKGRQPILVERLRDAEDELTALRAERYDTGSEIRALSARIQLAVHAERPDLALHVAGRLDALGEALLRRGLDEPGGIA